ncbi:DUF3025 domain-containing protein [Nitrosomonas sp.]|uniref:DUF3025 domain-containing protein n=1 Tax=Nitrosomonas sp. TaxID=42353 RepID=UPI001D7DB05F|nr:DUF3025 domain-containing protein [Nitrosomonas sp.]MCB1949604.1 DUF3025 domain-containing protein [Nitrosomonas sp.]MCP5242384.1 DUF3025 domain-containing protein [Burkholderiales bacterium]MDR4514618.1 DUF3025 domain-containing protein [Nitrosomonas sp.]
MESRNDRWDPYFCDFSPIFSPFSPIAHHVHRYSEWPTHQDIEALKQETGVPINAGSGLPIRFVPPESATREHLQQHYETRIYLTGEVLTRLESWHDFFNALVWMIFPHTKAALNRIHYRALKAMTSEKNTQRGSLRDAATLFDESGVIVLSSQPLLIELLKRHEWKTVFWQQRNTVLSSMRFIVFGHALFEKALRPYVGMTGKGVFFQIEEVFLRQPLTEQLRMIDRWLADFIMRRLTCNADMSPIPVLGYPGWTKDNVAEDYYDNRQYFRPFGSKKPSRRSGDWHSDDVGYR